MKKPRLFYWHEGMNAWTPAPYKTEQFLDMEEMFDGDLEIIKFKRIDMTDEEYANLPDGG